MTAYEQATAITETPSDRPVTEQAKAQATAVADTAKHQAGTVAEVAGSAAGEVVDTAREQLSQVAGEARQQVGTLADQAKVQVAEQAKTQQQKAASTTRGFADQLQALARGESTDGVAADMVREISERVQQIATKLENTEPQELLDEVRRYARNKPGAFLLTTAAAGFVSGRLVKGATAEGETGRASYTGRRAELTSGGIAKEQSVRPLGTAAGAPISGLERGSGAGYPSTSGTGTQLEQPRQNGAMGGAS